MRDATPVLDPFPSPVGSCGLTGGPAPPELLAEVGPASGERVDEAPSLADTENAGMLIVAELIAGDEMGNTTGGVGVTESPAPLPDDVAPLPEPSVDEVGPAVEEAPPSPGGKGEEVLISTGPAVEEALPPSPGPAGEEVLASGLPVDEAPLGGSVAVAPPGTLVDEPPPLGSTGGEGPRVTITTSDSPGVLLVVEEGPPPETPVLDPSPPEGAAGVVDVAPPERPVEDEGGCLVQSSPAASTASTRPLTASPTVSRRGFTAVLMAGTRAIRPWSAVTRFSTERLIWATRRQRASWSAKGRSRRLPTAGTGTAVTAVVTSTTLARMFCCSQS